MFYFLSTASRKTLQLDFVGIEQMQRLHEMQRSTIEKHVIIFMSQNLSSHATLISRHRQKNILLTGSNGSNTLVIQIIHIAKVWYIIKVRDFLQINYYS